MENFFYGFLLGACITGVWMNVDTVKTPTPIVITDPVPVQLEQPEFFLTDTPTVELVLQACRYYDIQHPEIVVSQAVLETGHFRSKLCVEHKNLFGLYNSYQHDFYKFHHWTESVKAYKDKIQNRYNDESDYYKWLEDLGYAEDTLYISKVKNVQEDLNLL